MLACELGQGHRGAMPRGTRIEAQTATPGKPALSRLRSCSAPPLELRRQRSTASPDLQYYTSELTVHSVAPSQLSIPPPK